MTQRFKTLLALGAVAFAAHAAAEVTFYEGEGFRGRAFTTERQTSNFAGVGFNDRASSVIVGKGRWEVCEHAGYQGRCVMLREGSYGSLQALGMSDRISSVRPASKRRNYANQPEPAAAVNYDWHRRANERVYNAPVTSVHAVMGPPTQRCWTEHQQGSGRGEPNVGGAIAGALIGGVLGHQVGGGSGKDIATVGGAVAGGVVGSNVGRGGSGGQDVRRCESTTSGTPAYWDVAYSFRGRDHQLQMSAPPGRTIVVNSAGEPRQ